MYCKMLQGEHSAILLTFIMLPFVIKIFVLSIFEWPFYTGFTVHVFKKDVAFIHVFKSCKIIPCSHVATFPLCIIYIFCK